MFWPGDPLQVYLHEVIFEVINRIPRCKPQTITKLITKISALTIKRSGQDTGYGAWKNKGTHFSTGPTTSSRHSKIKALIFVLSLLRHSIPFHRAKNITTSEWFEILYTFTTTCYKNILKISGPTPSRKPHYGISKFSIFFVYSCFSNPETLDKIRIFSSSICNFSYFSTF